MRPPFSIFPLTILIKARLAREETVKAIQRRLEERKEAEREKELSIKEKQLKTTLDGLRKEMKEVTEYLSPIKTIKKSRKEIRKHLQVNTVTILSVGVKKNCFLTADEPF